ncbi:hypothetical protein GCM10008955_30760 [Deinococcus malanensis]|uniref:Uncharacterized protein n=1 Tax=Deinococcus malanensis TaxID=1706855 RepID=A0ABQ2F0F4_9DEIO|nr:hypothetical protein [Deinococcus malanensis]GGK34617.1 hypothetical protein GCM10008955_30760 [Deinococcus malanensis]
MIEVNCTWIPGTLDMLHLRAGDRLGRLSIGELRRRFGLRAINALYLSGRFQTMADPSDLAGLALS